MKNRSRTDIVGLILEVANVEGDTKTKICKAFLSYSQLKQYLAMLMENSLLEFEEGMQFYRTTEKGIRFLQMYAQVHKMMSVESAWHNLDVQISSGWHLSNSKQSEIFHTKIWIALVTFELLFAWISWDHFKNTFCFTFWTSTIYRFLWQSCIRS